MKTQKFIALAIALTAPAIARPALGDPLDDKPHERRPASVQDNSDRLGPLQRSSKIIGTEVTDSAGSKLGKVRDLAVDLRSGRVLEVIVTKGGILGVGAKHVGLPPSMVSVEENGKTVAVGLDREKFQTAPEFDYDQWPDATRREQVASVYRHFSVEPRYLHDGRGHERDPANAVPESDSRHWGVERASKIVGLEVTNEAGDKVGKVDDLLVDLSAARVNTVIVSSGGFLGVGDELSGIPPSVFRYDSEHGKLALHVSKETLTAAPRFKGDDWSRYSTPENVVGIYKAYGVRPYFDSGTAVDNTARNVRDRNNRTLTPLDQGSSESDVKMTTDIRQAIVREEGLSVSAQNVKVITVNGRVVLRGPVNSTGEKDRIEEIARRVAGVDRVDNQLEVRAVRTNK